MQTFLPYSDFDACAQVLDDKRLGKQRVECMQILRAMRPDSKGWRNHPAVLMWKGYEEALISYAVAICTEWCRRGFADTCEVKLRADGRLIGVESIRSQRQLELAGDLPPWLGNPEFHQSHQSSLVRKDPHIYREYFPDIPGDLEYVWPVRSPGSIAAEQRAAQRPQRQAEAQAKRAAKDKERLSRARSKAAKKGWRTRKAASADKSRSMPRTTG